MRIQNQVFTLRNEQGEAEWRVIFNGHILAARWWKREAADAHLAKLEAGEARPHYVNPQEVAL